MAVNIGPRIGIDGESEYRKQIQLIIQETKTLKSEYEKLSSEYSNGAKTLKENASLHKALQDEIKAQEKRVEALANMLTRSKQEQDKLNDALQKAKYEGNAEEVKKLTGELENAENRTNKWQQALNEATTELIKMETELKALPNSLQLVGQKMQDVGNKIKGVGNSISGIGNTLTTRLTLPIAAAATKAVTSFAEVDKTMTLTNAVMSNTAEEAEALSDAMEKAAMNSTFGMSDAATASLNFARAGLDAKEAAAALAPAMNLAAGAGGNLDTVSNGLVATINGFSDSFDDAIKYADIFARATNNSALDVDSLSQAMSTAAPIFKTAGKSVEDAALFMGVMANNGIEAGEAANSLKTGLARIASPAKQGAQALDQLDIHIFDANGHMKDSVEVQRILHDSFADLSEQEQIAAASAIFGKNQMANWLALINTAPEEVQALSDSLNDTSVSAQGMADAMMSGFAGSIERLKSSLNVASVSFGEALAPTISKVADQIQALVDWFNSLDESEQQQIAKNALLVASAGPVLSISGKLVSSIGSIVTTGGSLTQGLGNVINLLGGSGGLTAAAGGAASSAGALGSGASAAGAGIASIAGPVAIATAAVLVLGGAFVTAYKNDEEFASEVKVSWGRIQTSITGVIDTVKPVWEKFSAGISPVFVAAMDHIANRVDAFQQKAQGLIDFVAGVFTLDWKRTWTGVNEMAAGVVNSIISKFEFMRDSIEGIFAKLDIKLPHIKLPHFKVEREDSWGLPHFSVEWYAKAMSAGMRLTSPTIFGADNGKLLAGGEAGNEWVIGENSILSMIQAAVNSALGSVEAGNTVTVGDTTINVYGAPDQDVEELADQIDEILSFRQQQVINAWA